MSLDLCDMTEEHVSKVDFRGPTLPGRGNKWGHIWDHTVASQRHMDNLITCDHLEPEYHQLNPRQQGSDKLICLTFLGAKCCYRGPAPRSRLTNRIIDLRGI